MRINHFISQTTIVGFLLGIFLLTTISCESCTQKELERDKATVIAQIEIENMHTLGSINTTQLVIELNGKIKENNINDTSILGVLVVPTGESVEKAAKEFREELSKSNKTLDKHTTHLVWSNQQCAAYYIAEISANEKKSVSGKVFLQGGLPSGKYQAYLMLHNLSYGTYTSEEGKEFEISSVDPTLAPTVETTFSKARVHLDHSGKPIIEVLVEANATNFGTMQGGFFFVEKKDPQTKPMEFLSELIKSEKDLPVTTDFEKLADVSDVIIHSFNDGAGSSQAKATNSLVKDDTMSLFKKGSTYDVYAYLYEPLSKEKRFVVSQEDAPITIAKIEVELEMKEAKITKMIKGLNNKPDDIQVMDFACTGEIKKQVATYKPQVGFILSVNRLDIDRDVAYINSVLAVNPVNGYYQLGKDVAFLNPAPIAENLTEAIPFSISIPEIPLELGKKYQVYFFLKDKGGDIFLSKEDVSLVVPNAELQINHFITKKQKGAFVVDQDALVTNEVFSTGLGQKTSTGYIIYAASVSSISKDFLEDILKNTNKIVVPPAKKKKQKDEDKYKNQLNGNNMVFVDKKSVGTSQPSLFNNQADSTLFNLALVFSCENAVFYKLADPTADPQQRFFWYNPDPDTKTRKEVDQGKLIDGYAYEYQPTTYRIWRVEDANTVEVELNDINEGLIEKILNTIFKGPDAPDDIREFKNKMEERQKKKKGGS